MIWSPLTQSLPCGKRIADCRYSIGLEFTGKASRQYVARHCGEWIGQRETFESALALLQGERAHHCAAMGIANESALSGDGPRAWRLGFSAARKCHAAYDRARIILGAVNPYARREKQALWAAGFKAGYARP